MVVPVYALLICIVIETSAFLPAKLGTTYSAYASARTATVWSTASTWEVAEEKSIQAGKRTFVPFASATQGLTLDAASTSSARYLAASKMFSSDASLKYLAKKYSYAMRAIDISITKPESWDDDVTATVTYEFPFNIPGVARIFGERRADGSWYLPITSSVTLQNEGSQGASNTSTNPLGIGYGILE